MSSNDVSLPRTSGDGSADDSYYYYYYYYYYSNRSAHSAAPTIAKTRVCGSNGILPYQGALVRSAQMTFGAAAPKVIWVGSTHAPWYGEVPFDPRTLVRRGPV